MKWRLAYRTYRVVAHGRNEADILLYTGSSRDGGAYLWCTDTKFMNHHKPDGFIDRKYILEGTVWFAHHRQVYLECEKEILEEAKKLIVKNML